MKLVFFRINRAFYPVLLFSSLLLSISNSKAQSEKNSKITVVYNQPSENIKVTHYNNETLPLSSESSGWKEDSLNELTRLYDLIGNSWNNLEQWQKMQLISSLVALVTSLRIIYSPATNEFVSESVLPVWISLLSQLGLTSSAQQLINLSPEKLQAGIVALMFIINLLPISYNYISQYISSLWPFSNTEY